MGPTLSSCCVASDAAGSLSDLPEDIRDLPPFFAEIILELSKYKTDLGGLRNFTDHPRVDHKVKAEEFRRAYTDYEYIYLTVLGFAQLHIHAEEIVQLNNGETFTRNPGVQMLERVCGMTMHGNRDGSNVLLRTAPASLLEAFQLSKSGRRGTRGFFQEAFDRKADPCLEGRTGRIMCYLERLRSSNEPASASTAPWEDISLRPMPQGARPRDVVGEHLRVFVNECTWRWARENEVDYEEAKTARLSEEHAAEFSRLFNAAAFEAAMRARGVVAIPGTEDRWEVLADDERWVAYASEANAIIERGRAQGRDAVEVRAGPGGYSYLVNMRRLVQQNPKTGKERPIRFVKAPPQPGARVTEPELLEAIDLFVDLETLPAAPPSSASSASTSS